jgi:hypothetical protein
VSKDTRESGGLSPAQVEAAETALLRAVHDPRRMFVRVQRAEGPVTQRLVPNLPELLDALEQGWTIHPEDI